MANGRTGRTPSKTSLFASGEEIAERKRKERDAFAAKQKKAREKRKAEREAKAAKRKEEMEESTARISERKRKASVLPKDRPKSALNPRGRSGSSANVAGSTAFAGALAKKKKDKKEDTKAQPKFGVGKEFTIRGGKANVTKEQLERTGLTQAQYMKQWRATNKRPTASTAKKSNTTSNRTSSTKAKRNVLLGKGAKFRPFGGVLARALLGEDEKFGGDRGAIDFLPGKSRPKKKAGGGMMKSKMASKGGAKGGRKPTGMKNGGMPMKTVNGKKVPAFAADGKGPNDLAKGKKPKGMQRGGLLSRARRRIKRQGGLDRQAGGRAVDVNIGQGLKKLAGGAGGGRAAGISPRQGLRNIAQQQAGGAGGFQPQAAGGRRRRRPAASPAGGPMGAMAGMGGAIPQQQLTAQFMANGGMMKSKGMAKGGSMKKKGMAKGGAMTKKGMAKGGAMTKKGMAKGGAMKKKGYAMGGMTKKGMAKGGPVKKKGMSKGGVRRNTKPRGVGAALRGYGKAMRK